MAKKTKAADSRKTTQIQFRVDEREKEAFDAAAKMSGLGTSAWIRERLRVLARKELQESGQRVPFLD
jgi:hypothetical protein